MCVVWVVKGGSCFGGVRIFTSWMADRRELERNAGAVERLHVRYRAGLLGLAWALA